MFHSSIGDTIKTAIGPNVQPARESEQKSHQISEAKGTVDQWWLPHARPSEGEEGVSTERAPDPRAKKLSIQEAIGDVNRNLDKAPPLSSVEQLVDEAKTGKNPFFREMIEGALRALGSRIFVRVSEGRPKAGDEQALKMMAEWVGVAAVPSEAAAKTLKLLEQKKRWVGYSDLLTFYQS